MAFKIAELVKKGIAGYEEHGPAIVAVLGDSVSHGCLSGNMHYDTVYHNRLRMMINTRYEDFPVCIINSAMSGATVWYALQHFERDCAPHHPDLCIVCFGLNDVNFELETYRTNLGTLFDKISGIGSECVFLTPNMLCTREAEIIPNENDRPYAGVCAGFQNSGRMDEFMDAARQVAKEHGVAVADCYAKWKELEKSGADITSLLANRVNHPTREMHEMFAEELYTTIFGEKYEIQ
ncbi:MAG: hypothetical protein IJU57_01680 [Clostridia bacterium]|nr:hypothetical protein [Clostridia bacterium]